MILIWIDFLIFVLGLLALDLGVMHRKAHVVSMLARTVSPKTGEPFARTFVFLAQRYVEFVCSLSKNEKIVINISSYLYEKI